MKKIFILAGLCLSIAAQAQLKNIADLTGKWEIAGEQNAYLQIIDSTTILLHYMGESRKISNIKIDCSKSPCWFDFSASDTSSLVQVKSIIEKAGDDVIKWQLFIDEERAPFFTTKKGELLYLKRSKAVINTASSN